MTWTDTAAAEDPSPQLKRIWCQTTTSSIPTIYLSSTRRTCISRVMPPPCKRLGLRHFEKWTLKFSWGLPGPGDLASSRNQTRVNLCCFTFYAVPAIPCLFLPSIRPPVFFIFLKFFLVLNLLTDPADLAFLFYDRIMIPTTFTIPSSITGDGIFLEELERNLIQRSKSDQKVKNRF